MLWWFALNVGADGCEKLYKFSHFSIKMVFIELFNIDNNKISIGLINERKYAKQLKSKMKWRNFTIQW